MASYYTRKRSKWLWIKWYDESGKPCFESTNRFVRISGKITPCLAASRDGERMAKKICEEIEAAKKLHLEQLSSKFIPKREHETTIKEAFDKYKQINKYKNPKTIHEYEKFYEVLSKTFAPSSSCESITRDEAENWILFIREFKSSKTKQLIKQNTIYNYQKNFKKFLNFLFDRRFIKIPFVISKDVQVKQIAGSKMIIQDVHIHKILEGLDSKGPNFKMCVYLLTFTGLRPSDIINIPINKIDVKRGTLEYYSQKGKEYRTIPIAQQIIPLIKERIKEVATGNLIEYSDYGAIGKAFKRYLKLDLKLDVNYSPRAFRKSYDTWAYENGMDTIANSRLVGHSILTAEKNYREVNVEQLRKEQSKFKIPDKPKESQDSDTI